MRNSRFHGCRGLGSSDWAGNTKLPEDVDRIYESRVNPSSRKRIYDSAMHARDLRPFEMERRQKLRLSEFQEVEVRAGSHLHHFASKHHGSGGSEMLARYSPPAFLYASENDEPVNQ